MIQQLLLHLLPVISIGIIAYLTYSLSLILISGSAGAFKDLKWVLSATPALNSYLVFIARAYFLAALLLGTFGRTSNHIIMSLDILYLISLLMLILFHNLKQPNNSPFKVV